MLTMFFSFLLDPDGVRLDCEERIESDGDLAVSYTPRRVGQYHVLRKQTDISQSKTQSERERVRERERDALLLRATLRQSVSGSPQTDRQTYHRVRERERDTLLLHASLSQSVSGFP